MHIYKKPSAAAAKRLINECGLPIEDLTDASFEYFYAAGAPDDPDGVVGIELYGSTGLLRSLAVAPNARRRGVAKRLVAKAETYAKALGVTHTYLLTESASGLFASLGYEVASREHAPDAIRNSTQFSSICPDSATFMVKRL